MSSLSLAEPPTEAQKSEASSSAEPPNDDASMSASEEGASAAGGSGNVMDGVAEDLASFLEDMFVENSDLPRAEATKLATALFMELSEAMDITSGEPSLEVVADESMEF